MVEQASLYAFPTTIHIKRKNRVWALAFIHYVREDLQLFVSGNKSKLMYDFTEIQCTQIVTNLDALELELNKVELIQFYGQYED